MRRIEHVRDALAASPKIWLVTVVAGFIGSNFLEALLMLDQHVVGLDNFSTGFQHNLDEVATQVTPPQWERFTFIRGDIHNTGDCAQACAGVDHVLHQVALGSVKRSLDDPISTDHVNIGGFMNILVASRDAKVESFTCAGSTYGDHLGLPKTEEIIGKPLSPHAVTKHVNELYAEVFARTYGFHTISLRYFNVFGKRHNSNGSYAAVIPTSISSFLNGEMVLINAVGYTSRNFTFIDNAVQANLLAATAGPEARD